METARAALSVYRKAGNERGDAETQRKAMQAAMNFIILRASASLRLKIMSVPSLADTADFPRA